MDRLSLLRKLRALERDPAAAPNERAVAKAKADALEAAAPEPPPQYTGESESWSYWSGEFSEAEWNALPEPLAVGGAFGYGWALGAYSAANLHRALNIQPDGSMRCRCHGPGRLTLQAGELEWQRT